MVVSIRQPDELIVLDGGLATEFEARGHDLNHFLWSARMLIEAPGEILNVHRSYLNAGADCITTASYQASIDGFSRIGIEQEQAAELIRLSVQMTKQACNELPAGRTKQAMVAASVGPYGAILADGSEYRGDYQLSDSDLIQFHRPRWQILAEEKPDVMLCETVPSLVEATALAMVANEFEIPTWISFSCRDGLNISDGTPVRECVEVLNGRSIVTAVGVNCTAPRFINSLIDEISSVTDKQIIVYPNSGESFDATHKRWSGEDDVGNFAEQAVEWRQRGASIIGGCCRTTPAHIRAAVERLV